MKTTAMVLNEYGESAKFTKSEISLDELKDDQVLVEVNATSINPVDNKILRGVPLGPELPSPIHGDVSGIVIEIGKEVTMFKPGDQIFGIAGGLVGYCGATANHMIVNQSLIYHKPKTASFIESASLPLVFITAYEGLVEKAKLQKGQNILVIGGTGGVGHQVIQLAKILGARVTTTVSSEEKGKIVKMLGADVVINRKEMPQDEYCKFANVDGGFDVIFDTVGGENIDKTWELVRPNGQVITTSSEGHDLSQMHMKGLSLHVVFMLLPMLTHQDQERHQKILKYLSEKVNEGAIKTLVDEKPFNLEAVNEAHDYFESGKHIGKIVIDNTKSI